MSNVNLGSFLGIGLSPQLHVANVCAKVGSSYHIMVMCGVFLHTLSFPLQSQCNHTPEKSREEEEEEAEVATETEVFMEKLKRFHESKGLFLSRLRLGEGGFPLC